MGVINNFLKVVAPKLALRRLQHQMTFDTITQNQRKHDGAGRGRRFGDNNFVGPSQNQQISSDLPLLRERSREANRNNPYAKKATRSFANNVVGTGILANPVVEDPAVAKLIKKVWKEWADSTLCDFDGLQNFYGLTALSVGTVAKSGECYARRIWSKRVKNSKVVPLEIQLLDPDFIDHQKNTVQPFDNGEYIVNGVQYNKKGKRIAYWVFDRHPTEVFTESKPVPASEMSPMFYMEDPGQVHGLPFNSSIILRMKDFDEYEDAQLMKQKIAACFAVFVQRSNGDSSSIGAKSSDNSIERLAPGMINYGEDGETFTFSNPPQVDGYRDFTRTSLQGQAAGFGLSYETYTGDLSGVNFSSGRMGWLEAQRFYEMLQWNMVIPMFLNPIWQWFTQAAYIAGKIPSPDVAVTWTPPRREMIDPLKEIQALLKQVRAGFISWQDAVRSLGYAPEEIVDQMKEDKERFDKAKLMPESDPRYDADKLAKIDQIEAKKED
ncbi:MAG: phage portal protein [Sphingobacteriaceae bacterium]|nr:phage portal protein [Sphingobacteriaceae bacterium]